MLRRRRARLGICFAAITGLLFFSITFLGGSANVDWLTVPAFRGCDPLEGHRRDATPNFYGRFEREGAGTDYTTPGQIEFAQNLGYPPDMEETVGKWLSTWSQEVRNEFQELVDAGVSADDERLLRHIHRMLIPPATHRTRKVSHEIMYTPQAKVASSLLKNKTHGFFVECGALDGERSSNSIYLEEYRKWEGLLIEADPYYFLTMLGRNRKAYSINACLSPSDRPSMLHFREHRRGSGRLFESGGLMVPCYPLYSLLRAMNISKVDFFSLDVEGAEYPVLDAFPFDKIDVSVLTVEVAHGYPMNETKMMMDKKGYNVAQRIHHIEKARHLFVDDAMFIKKEFPV